MSPCTRFAWKTETSTSERNYLLRTVMLQEWTQPTLAGVKVVGFPFPDSLVICFFFRSL